MVADRLMETVYSTSHGPEMLFLQGIKKEEAVMISEAQTVTLNQKDHPDSPVMQRDIFHTALS